MCVTFHNDNVVNKETALNFARQLAILVQKLLFLCVKHMTMSLWVILRVRSGLDIFEMVMFLLKVTLILAGP